MEDESQVVVECYAKVGTAEIRFCHLLLVRPEMAFQFQLEAKASVWCILENPYLAVRQSTYDGEPRLVVAARYANKLLVVQTHCIDDDCH